jgi:hypothetical protein
MNGTDLVQCRGVTTVDFQCAHVFEHGPFPVTERERPVTAGDGLFRRDVPGTGLMR